MPKTLEEWKDLIVENLITDDDIKQIINNQTIVDRVKKERDLWEEPMDSSFSNEIRRSVIRTLDEILYFPKTVTMDCESK